MHIVYDNIIFSLQKAGGISVYWYELIKRFKSSNIDIIFYESKNENIFRYKLDIETIRERNLPIILLRFLPFTRKIPKGSIFHSSYYRISLQKDVVNIVTIHDFIYEYFKTGIRKTLHSLQKRIAIKYADGIICVSENTKRDLLKFFPNLNKKKIKVIYNGVSEEYKILKNRTKFLSQFFPELKNIKYILYVGDRSKYKNFDVAVKIIKKLKDYYLVIVGGGDLKREEAREIENRYFHFKAIDNHKLNILYNNAHCLLYPSSYEGFGIPILEAMKSGCPVVSVKTSSIPEIAGNAALLVEKIDIENFIEKIKLLEKKKVRESLIVKGLKQAKKFSWDKCFEETYEFYKEVYNAKFG